MPSAKSAGRRFACRKVLEFETTLHESIRLLDEAVKQLKASAQGFEQW